MYKKKTINVLETKYNLLQLQKKLQIGKTKLAELKKRKLAG